MGRRSTRREEPTEPPRRVTAQTIKAWAEQAGIHRDPESRGLALRVRASGAAFWVLRYSYRGTPRIWTIGRYPDLGLADAREKADDGRTRIANGDDPASDKRFERAQAARERANSIDALCTAYIEKHAKPRKRTWRDDQGKINCEILPMWKGRPVTSITRRDCRALIQTIADRPAPVYANRIAALLSRLFRFAVDEEIIETNPAAHLPKPGVEAQARPDGEQEENAYDADEIRAIWQATETLDAALKAIYRLGLVTGQRPAEISNMEWPEIGGSWWSLPGRRTKNGRTHRVFLTPMALELLADVPRLDDRPPAKKATTAAPKRPKPRYAFAGFRGKRQLAEINTQVFANVRRRTKPRHALRSTVATGLAGCGVSTEDISKVLNHTYGSSVTGRYNEYQYDREKRLALGKWARKLTTILEQTEESNKVVQIERQA